MRQTFIVKIVVIGVFISSSNLYVFNFNLYLLRPVFAIPVDQTTVVLSSWAVPTNSKDISSMVSDFAGTLYFAENNASKIGRLVPATNMITEWSQPNTSSRPNGVAFDPSSGGLYFIENNANKIGRLVPATNIFTEWNISRHPLVIAVNPGGHCFFVDDMGRIGRLG